MATGEVFAVVAAALVAKLGYVDFYLGLESANLPYLSLGLLLGLILHIFYRRLGLYDAQAIGHAPDATKLLSGLALAFVTLISFLFLIKTSESYSRIWMVSWFALTGLFVAASRLTMHGYARRLIASGRMRQRIGIYGPTGRSLQLAQLLAASCQGVEIVGLYDGPGGPVLDSRSQGLDRLIADSRSGGIGQIIVALPLEEQEAIRRTVERLAVLPVDVQLCTEISPFPVPVHKTDRLADIAVHLVSPRPLSDRAKLVKAIMDFGIASVGLLLCLPLMAVVTLAVKFADGGPVFFRQRRLGENQRQFVIYKFRTMKVMEDGAFIRQAKENDARVTRIGRFLRRTSLDELPQLINVLRGEMSLVGPRPHAVAHDETFERQLPHYARRHRVKPGITGWAQVNGLRGETKSPDDMRRRMEHDLHYINNWSIGLDLKILLSTVVAVLAGHKAY